MIGLKVLNSPDILNRQCYLSSASFRDDVLAPFRSKWIMLLTDICCLPLFVVDQCPDGPHVQPYRRVGDACFSPERLTFVEEGGCQFIKLYVDLDVKLVFSFRFVLVFRA